MNIQKKLTIEATKPTGSTDLEENGALIFEAGAKNGHWFEQAKGKMAAQTPKTKPIRMTNDASVSHDVGESHDQWLDHLKSNLDRDITFLSNGHVDDGYTDRAIGLEMVDMVTAKMVTHRRICPMSQHCKRPEIQGIAGPITHTSEDLAAMVHKCVLVKVFQEAAKMVQDKATEYGVSDNCLDLVAPWVEDLCPFSVSCLE